MRVLITRPRDQADEFAQGLESIGAEAIHLPTIEIRPVDDTIILDRAITRLQCYDWLVLTSVNAVNVFMERMTAIGVSMLPENLRAAAVGPKTASSMETYGIQVDFVPQEFVGEAILPGLGDLRGRWVLLPTADIASDYLPKAIEENGGVAHVITAYHTLPAEPDPEGLEALRSGVDLLTFTSGSTARNFVFLAHKAGLDPLNLPGTPRVACIGPKTARVARELGIDVDIIADSYSIDGLVASIDTKMNRTTLNENL